VVEEEEEEEEEGRVVEMGPRLVYIGCPAFTGWSIAPSQLSLLTFVDVAYL